MAVPDFQSIMLPLLKIAEDGQEHSGQEFLERLAECFNLSDDELNELLPSGKQTRFYNRVGWARTYLIKSKLLEMPRRSFYKITERGKEVLKSNPDRIDMNYLKRFPEYIEFKSKENEKDKGEQKEENTEESTPEEILDGAYQEIRDNLALEVLENVMSCSPAFFERLVVELLVAMGYGGSRRDAARAVGQTGDEGIDGIIDEDRLGLDTIYIQAKKWANNVGRPEIQKFVGALAGKRARKGIFITTSSFSSDAVRYASDIDTKVILIDGKRLAELMMDYNIGVNEVTTYKLKRIDSDYFSI
ncbi:MAG: restriction endonuclease [Anaerolineaceae bacterium]|jgi:restriction system protein|nr:restriction endonuclease [Anaerolineaceae bacterium]OQY89375.1 MAG: restriction endonuclease [Anaerolineae bacterium UTCFX1]